MIKHLVRLIVANCMMTTTSFGFAILAPDADIPSDATLVFRGPKYQITAPQSQNLLAHGKWYLAQLPPHISRQELNLSPYLWQTLPDHTAAIFAINSADDLATLSRLTHQTKGFACGRLLPLRPLPLAQTSLTPIPLYDPRAELTTVKQLLATISANAIAKTVAALEAFPSRFHTTTGGRETPATVLQLFQEAAGGLANFSTATYSHQGSKQESVIAKITGTTAQDEVIVIGSHLDSTNANGVSIAPGADDNATGVATLVELLRVLAAQNHQFARSIEFHAYAAEEVGLVGSYEIATSYAKAQTKVIAMMQLDMTAYYDQNEGPKINVIATDTHRNLTMDLARLTHNYTAVPYTIATLDGGTSDHRSWFDNNYPTAFAFEDPEAYNPFYHSAGDTTANLPGFSQSKTFAQLSASFLAHYGGLQAAQSDYKEWQSAFSPLALTLPIAIFGGAAGLYQIAISSSEPLGYAQICETSATKNSPCHTTRIPLKANGSRGGRYLFVSGDNPEVALASGHFYRIEAFAADHKFAGSREFALE